MPRWTRYLHEGKEAIGAVEGEEIAEHAGSLFDSPRPTGKRVKLADVALLTPTAPSKMIALANNSRPALEKNGAAIPAEPLYLMKANSSFCATGATIGRPPGYDGKIVFEGELGLVIGRECRAVSEADAYDYLLGCACINDVTAIEILNRDPSFAQWVRSKAWDNFGVYGPVVATDVDPEAVVIRTVLDGQERQNYPITDMVFGPAALISRISHDMTLLPGDVIACGTSIGVGSMKPGNVVEVSIEGVGSLVNVFDPAG